MLQLTESLNKIKNNSFWNQLISNVFSAFLGESGSAVINVITTVVMVRGIGDISYGMFVIAQSYMLIVDGLINMQSWQAVIKYGSEYIEKSDYDGLRATIKVGMVVDLLTAILGTLVAVFLSPLISQFFGWNKNLLVCVVIFSLEICFHFSGSAVGVLRLFGRFNFVAIQKILVAFIKLVAVIAFVLGNGVSLITIVAVYTAADVIGHLVLTAMAFFTMYKEESLGIRNVLSSNIHGHTKKYWNFAWWTHLTSCMDIPVKQLDVFIMSTISYEMVSVYKVFKQIGNLLVQISLPISQAIMPQFSELIAKGNVRSCWSVVLKLRKVILRIMLPIVLLIAVVSPWILDWVFGEIYAKHFYILVLYLLSRTFALSYTTIHQLFVSMGKVKQNFVYTAASNVIYLIGAIILSKYLGIMGLVMALFLEYFSVISLKKRAIKKELGI